MFRPGGVIFPTSQHCNQKFVGLETSRSECAWTSMVFVKVALLTVGLLVACVRHWKIFKFMSVFILFMLVLRRMPPVCRLPCGAACQCCQAKSISWIGTLQRLRGFRALWLLVQAVRLVCLKVCSTCASIAYRVPSPEILPWRLGAVVVPGKD